MLKFFLIVVIFFNAGFLFAQNTDTPADTIEGASTDTSIIYIIKRPAVTIREKVEIQREKKKRYLYLSLGLSGLVYTEKLKAKSGYEEYVKELKTTLSPLPSYMIGGRLWWWSSGKLVTGVTFYTTRLLQKFEYTDLDGIHHVTTNKYNYYSAGLTLGNWYKKGEKFSYIVVGGITLDYFLSGVGYTLDKSDPQQSARLNRVISHTKYSPSLTAGFKLLFAIKESFIEAEPFIIFAPFSATTKKEVYSTSRNFIGLKLGLTNKLF
jgi:hypothetical protein